MSTTDPTAKKGAQSGQHLTADEKIKTAFALVNEIQTGMLTTRSPDGKLASRAMIHATLENNIFSFYFNRESGKTDDVKADDQVNLSYLNSKTGDWVSVSGKATINTDKNKVKKHWSSSLKAWFDDKKDGKHTGDENDPRVALIDVHPEEIRLFKADGKLRFLFETATAALSGEAASGGKMLIIDESELKAHAKVH
ncbi:hypothetical protein L7F22_053858 [Adiantum nelumboides]|nr:hypothetical protein [Adiantum nelumboides]